MAQQGLALSTGQGQGSAVTLRGMAGKPDTSSVAEGLRLYQEGVDKNLAKKALKKQEALAKISSARKNANEFYLGDLADQSNKIYDDLFTEVEAGNITPEQLIQELDKVTAQVQTFHRQDDAVRNFVEAREGQEIFNPETGEYEDVAIFMQDYTIGDNRFGKEFLPDIMAKIASSGERGEILDPQSLRQAAVEKTRQTSAQKDTALVGTQGGQNIFETTTTFDPVQVKAAFMGNPATLEAAAERVAKRNNISRFQARLLPETQEEMEVLWSESQPVTKQQQTTRAEKSPKDETKDKDFTGKKLTLLGQEYITISDPSGAVTENVKMQGINVPRRVNIKTEDGVKNAQIEGVYEKDGKPFLRISYKQDNEVKFEDGIPLESVSARLEKAEIDMINQGYQSVSGTGGKELNVDEFISQVEYGGWFGGANRTEEAKQMIPLFQEVTAVEDPKGEDDIKVTYTKDGKQVSESFNFDTNEGKRDFKKLIGGFTKKSSGGAMSEYN